MITAIRLWDIRNGVSQHLLERHTGTVHSVAFSPDGNTLASGSEDKTIGLWDTRSGESLRSLKGHTEAIWSVAFSPDGNTIASGSQDNTIRLWDSRSGESTKTLTGHSNWVMSVAFSPDGATIASAGGNSLGISSDNTIRLWDAHSGDSLRTLQGHTGMVLSVAFSTDGSTLASGSWDGTVLLWSFKLATTWGNIKQMTAVGDSNYVQNLSPPASSSTPTATITPAKLPQSVQPRDMDTISTGESRLR